MPVVYSDGFDFGSESYYEIVKKWFYNNQLDHLKFLGFNTNYDYALFENEFGTPYNLYINYKKVKRKLIKILIEGHCYLIKTSGIYIEDIIYDTTNKKLLIDEKF